MTDRADLKRLTGAGRQVAVGDQVMDLATAVELVRILDAIDRAVDELEEEQAPLLEPARLRAIRRSWHTSDWRSRVRTKEPRLMTDDGKEVKAEEGRELALMARLDGIAGPNEVDSYSFVDLAQMQALGLPHTRPLGALVMANEPGTELHVTYAMEIDESPEDVATRLPVFRSDGWPTDEGWTQTPREWKACST